jgi:hypothetical protein
MLFLHVILLDHGLHLVICSFLGNEKGATVILKQDFQQLSNLDEDQKKWFSVVHVSILYSNKASR